MTIIRFDNGTEVAIPVGTERIPCMTDPAGARIDGWMKLSTLLAALSGVSSINGATGAVTLGADDILITDSGGYFGATDIEGALLQLAIATQTIKITNTITGGVITPDADTDLVRPATLTAALTVANPATTPVNGWSFVVELIADGTARAITWGSNYASDMATLPTTTTAGKRHEIGFEYNATAGKMRCKFAKVQP